MKKLLNNQSVKDCMLKPGDDDAVQVAVAHHAARCRTAGVGDGGGGDDGDYRANRHHRLHRATR